MVLLTLNGTVAGYFTFGILNGGGIPSEQLVAPVKLLRPQPGVNETIYVLVCGRVAYTHSANPSLINFEVAFWTWIPFVVLVSIGAFTGFVAAYLINRWFIQGRIRSAPALLSLSHESVSRVREWWYDR
jgi:hypothetical protein